MREQRRRETHEYVQGHTPVSGTAGIPTTVGPEDPCSLISITEMHLTYRNSAEMLFLVPDDRNKASIVLKGVTILLLVEGLAFYL